MSAVDLILANLLPLLAGAGFMAAIGIGPRADRLAWLGWSLMSGFLVAAAILWAALAFELPLTPGWMRAVLLVVAVLGTAIGLGRSRGAPAERREALAAGTRIGMAICLVLAAASATDSVLFKMTTPVAVKDEATNWTSKAKQLYSAGGFNEALARDVRGSLPLAVRAPHPNYPNLVPLVHLWSFVNAGRILHFESRIPILLFRYALVLVLAGALLRRSRSPFIGLLLLPATFNLYRIDEGADVIAAFGFLVTVDALSRFFEGGPARWWRLAALGAMFLGAAKHEGQILLLAIAGGASMAFLCIRERGRLNGRDLLWLLLPAAAIASTWWFNQRFDVWNAVVSARADGSTFAGRIVGHLGVRGPKLAAATRDILGGIGLGARLLPLLFLVLVAACVRPAFSARVGWLTIVVALAWAGMIPIFLGTPYPFDWFVNVALARVMDQWTPVIALWIAALWREVGASPAGAVRRFRDALIAVCVVIAAAAPLVRLWQADVPSQAVWASGVLQKSEDERLALYLGGRWECFRALRDRSPSATPVVLVLPLSAETSDVWAQFTALLYPKRVLCWVPGAEFLTAVLREHNIDYDNSLAAVAKLAGPEFDVAVIGTDAPPPDRLAIDVRERGPGFVIGRVLGVRAPDTR